MTLRGLLSALRPDDGAIAVMAGMSLTVVMGMAALAVDMSVLFTQKRALQSATDAAALASVYDLSRAAAIAAKSLAANGFPAGTLSGTTVVSGIYCPDPTLSAAARFGQARCAASPLIGSTPNAVRVTASLQSPLYFARVITAASSAPITATATASRIDEAGIAAGTGLLSVSSSQSPLLNAVMSGLLGGSISLSAAQYNGLLNTNIDALTFFNALATQMNVTGGTYGGLLATNVGLGSVLQAAIVALNKGGNVAGARANALSGLQSLQAQIAGSPSVTLANLFSLGVWQNQPLQTQPGTTALQAGLNAYQLASLAAQVANGSNAVTIPPSSLGIPGIATVTAASTVIEPIQRPPFAFGPVGVSVHTAQVRMQLNVQLLQALPLTGLPFGVAAPASALVNVPIYVEVGSGTATLAAISCGFNPATDATVTISAQSAAVQAYIGNVPAGQITNFSQPVPPAQITPAALISTPLNVVSVTGASNVAVGSPQPTSLVFSQTQIASQTAQEVTSTGMAANFLGTLGSQPPLVLTAYVLGLKLPLASVTTALTQALTPVFASLDGLIDPMLAALGIKVGYMDVYATGVRCGVPALVQ